MVVMFLIILCFMLADIYTTSRILERGGVELNPIVGWLIKKLGLKWGLRVRLPIQLLGLIILLKTNLIVISFIAFVYFLVILNNTIHLNRLNR